MVIAAFELLVDCSTVVEKYIPGCCKKLGPGPEDRVWTWLQVCVLEQEVSPEDCSQVEAARLEECTV